MGEKKKAAPRSRFHGRMQGADQPWTLSLKSLPAVKAGTRLAGILIFSPVFGIQTLTGGALAGLEGAETENGHLLALHHRIDDGFDGGVDDQRHVGLGELRAGGHQMLTRSALFIVWGSLLMGGDGGVRDV